MSNDDPTASSLDTVGGRWRQLPALLRLLWQLGRRESLLIGVISALYGVVSVLSVIVLGGLVNSVVALITGSGELSSAVWWLGGLLSISLVEYAMDELNDWVGLEIRERITARAEQRLLEKAGSLTLAAFEKPELYDQLHRAQRALDERLVTSLRSLFLLPSSIVRGVGLLGYLATAHWVFPLILIVGFIPLHAVTLSAFRKVWILTRAQTPYERRLKYLDDLMTKREPAAELRLFGLGSYFLSGRQELAGRLRRERFDLAREHIAKLSYNSVGDEISYAAVIIGVVALIVRGSLTVGHFASYLVAAERFRNAMSITGYYLLSIDADLRYIADLISYLQISDEDLLDSAKPTSDEPVAERSVSPPTVEFSGVSFGYPGTETQVLDGIVCDRADG